MDGSHERMRRRREVEAPRSDQTSEEKVTTAVRRMECTFEVAHLTWIRERPERHDSVVLGWASEPMS